MKKRSITAAALIAAMLTAAVPAAAETFEDVADTAWYHECIDYITDNGLIDSVDETHFAPEERMTRGALVTAIGRLEGVDISKVDGSRFTDIPAESICAPYAAWAGENNIVAGYDGHTFGPDDLLTREQMAMVLYNYYKYLNENTQITKVSNYTDGTDISDWARKAVHFCSERGIMNGNDKNEFLPAGTLTRAETAQVIYNIAKSNEVEVILPEISGTVTDIDHHGHIITDITVQQFVEVGFITGDIIGITVDGAELKAPYCTSYTDVDNDQLVILSIVDGKHISVAINMGSFASTYNVKVGDTISFAMAEKFGYDAELELRSSVIYTYDRNDYSSDEAFANFRGITAGDIKPGRLYRSSTPIETVLGRNSYADVLCADAKIETVINFTNPDMEEVKSCDGYEGSYYSTLDIHPFIVRLDMEADIFRENMPEALRVIKDARTPILVHCQQGRDQTGLMAMILEALCGASYDEIVEDYMLSYENFYHIEKGSDQWQHIADGNIIPSMLKMTGAADAAELKTLDLKAAAESYLLGLGLSPDEIKAIYNKLCSENK